MRYRSSIGVALCLAFAACTDAAEEVSAPVSALVITPDCNWGCLDPDPHPTSPGVYLTSLYSGDMCVETGNDADGDGLWDDCEYQLAAAFAPELVLASAHETFTGREPHWVARPLEWTASGETAVLIMYLLSYYVDGGTDSPICRNYFAEPICQGHYGDSEWILLKVEYDSETEHWVLKLAEYSQHSTAGWYEATTKAYPTALVYPTHIGAYPRAYVSVNKHANYPNPDACDDGGFWGFDYCFLDSYERVTVTPWSGLGSRQLHAVSQDCIASSNPIYSGNGETECYWTVREFGGWQGAYPKTDDYSTKLAVWGEF